MTYAEVIGDPVAQSKSPAIYKFWLARAGIDADYRAHRVSSAGLADYFASRRNDPDWRGCNVTMPHKQAVMPLLDRIDPLAARIGAVNTIVCDAAGDLVGHNTDAAGFVEPLAAELGRGHLFRMARIIGTGGAARAIIAALSDRGFVLVVAGRDPDKAARLLAELDPEHPDHHAVALDVLRESADFAFDDREGICDLVINASSLGMVGQPVLNLQFGHVPPGSICYDIVTAPVDTPFLVQARERGFRTIDGLAMLIGQAASAFELFFGAKPPRDADHDLRERLSR